MKNEALRRDRAVVVLRAYKGKKTYDAKGAISSDNQKVTLIYGSKEGENFMKHCKVIGFTDIDVEDIIVKGESNTEHIESITEEFKAIFAAPAVALTPEQKKIAELEAKLNALMEGKAPKKESKKEAPKAEAPKKEEPASEEEDIADVRAEYEAVFGKKPLGFMKIPALKKAIKEAQDN